MAGWSGILVPYTQGLYRRNGQLYIRIVRTIQKQKATIEQRINDFFVKYGNYVAIGLVVKFSQTAARYTPPNMGKGNIEQKYYYRPIYKIEDLAKGLIRTSRGRRLYATKEDFAALRNGYKFKIMNTKYRVRAGTVFAYAKGINEAKRLSKIERRGLAKYSWGGMMNNTAEAIQNQLKHGYTTENMQVFALGKLPPVFQRLARKSPDITKYNWGAYDWQYYPNDKNVQTIKFDIENRLAQIEAYGKLAIQQGLRSASAYANSLWKGIEVIANSQQTNNNPESPDFYGSESQKAIGDLRKSMVRMFDNLTQKYNVQIVKDIRSESSVPEGNFLIRRS